MKFHNTNEITKYYQKLIYEGKVDELNSSLVNSSTDATTIPLVTKQDLEKAANALRDYLLTHIKRYFDSYDPAIYERTGQLLDSIQVKVINNAGTMQAHVYFDSSKTMRDSLFEGGGQGDALLSLDKGWEVKKNVWFKDIEHFGYFDGVGFIRSALADAEGDERFRNIIITPSEELLD
jgi:hypothetical protein